MGFLDRLRGDPMKKAERCLTRGDARGAVNALERAPASPARDGLLASARATLIDNLIAKADLAESDGFPEDALEWLRGALAEDAASGDASRKEAIEARASRLEAKIAADAEARDREIYDLRTAGSGAAVASKRASGDDSGAREDGADLDGQPDLAHWSAYVDMLREPVRARYEAAGSDFAKAMTRLHAGDLDAALAAFEPLADGGREVGVIALERGRARLLKGDAEGAVDDLDRAWSSLGDETLDEAASWSVPQLWAEAALDRGSAAAVVARLRPLAGPERMDLAEVYGRALLDANEVDEAVTFLDSLLAYTASPPIVRLRAKAADAAGDSETALGILEHTVAACCATGTCSKGAFDAEAVRMLVDRYLARGESADVDRSHDLLGRLIAEQGGQVGPADCRLLARYFRAIGDDERADEADSAADQAGDGGEAAGNWGSMLGGTTGQAAL